jgi:hypothetical protein
VVPVVAGVVLPVPVESVLPVVPPEPVTPVVPLVPEVPVVPVVPVAPVPVVPVPLVSPVVPVAPVPVVLPVVPIAPVPVVPVPVAPVPVSPVVPVLPVVPVVPLVPDVELGEVADVSPVVLAVSFFLQAPSIEASRAAVSRIFGALVIAFIIKLLVHVYLVPKSPGEAVENNGASSVLAMNLYSETSVAQRILCSLAKTLGNRRNTRPHSVHEFD